MQYNQEEVAEIFEIVFDLSAKEIFEKVEKVRNRPELAKRRWFWELLQNAKDAVKPNEQVSVKLILSKDSSGQSFVEFQHNGNPFRYKDARNLIFPYSDKDEEENSDKSGKFGTGFLATHILSDTIQVQGIYNKEENGQVQYFDFSFLLNRSGVNKNEISKNINASWQEFKTKQTQKHNYVYSPNQQEYETRFRYNLNIETENVVKNSLKNIQEVLPYVFAFIPKIKKVEVFNVLENCVVDYHIHTETSLISSNIKAFEIVRQETNQNHEYIKIMSCFDEEIEIAIQISQENNEQTLIVPFPENQPFIFTPFPSIASKENSIHLPFVVNSTKFIPKEERDGVWLNDERYGVVNQTLFEKVKPLYGNLLNFASLQNWKNTYLLLNHLKTLPSSVSDFNTIWFRDKVQNELKSYALTVPLVDNKFGVRKAINQPVLFPSDASDVNRNSIWIFLAALYPEAVPNQSELHAWYNVSWEGFNKISISELTKRVSQNQTVENLTLALKKSKEDTLKWLDEVVGFVNSKEPNLFNEQESQILPNQNPTGVFCKKAELWLDNDTIDEDLKAILAKIANLTNKTTDWRNEMLDKSIYPANLNFPHDRVHNIQQIGLAISEIVKEMLKNDSPTNEFRDLFSELLNWLSENPLEANEYFKGLKTETLLYRTANEHKIKLVTSILKKDRNGDLPLEKLDNPNLALIIDLGEKVLNHGYTKEDILNLISIPKGEQIIIAREEYERLKIFNILHLPIKAEEEADENKYKIALEFLISEIQKKGIQSVAELLGLLDDVIAGKYILRPDFNNTSSTTLERVEIFGEILAEALQKAITILKSKGYEFIGTVNKSCPTVFNVSFQGEQFFVIIRPAHGSKYKIFYDIEFAALQNKRNELWLADKAHAWEETLGGLITRIIKAGSGSIPTYGFISGIK